MKIPRVAVAAAALALSGAACLHHARRGVVGAGAGAGAAGDPTLAGYPALRWVPPAPSYVLAGPSARDLTVGLATLARLGANLIGVDVAELHAGLQALLGVDALDVDALASIGIDPGGGVALFATDVEPTVVVRLAAPEAMTAFLDRLRQRGLVTRSVVVDGVEVFTARLVDRVAISWAAADGWFWAHVGAERNADGAWFTASRHAAATPWAADWAWAKGASAGPATSVLLVRGGPLRAALARLGAVDACLRLVEPVARVGGRLGVDTHAVDGELRLDLGSAAGRLAAVAVPAPAGWARAKDDAAVAVGWGIDLAAVAGYLAPCAAALDERLPDPAEFGVRGGRALLRALDLGAASGRGAVALSLDHRRYFDHLLGEVTGRSLFEHDRTFGAIAGHRLSVPTLPDVDYVLDAHRGAIAVGDGVLAELLGDGGDAAAPLAELTVRPGKLPDAAWKAALQLLGLGGDRAAATLLRELGRWKEAALTLTLDGQALVLTGRGAYR
jgi:hypothetical protein